MKNNCMDCGKFVSNYATRCHSCAIREQIKEKGHPNFKDGRSLRKNYCVDCGEELSCYQAKRCRSCAMRRKRKKHTNSNCQCASCKSKRGELSGKNSGMFGVHRFGKESSRYGQKSAHGISIKYKGIYMRSTWETLFAQFLDLSELNGFMNLKDFILKTAPIVQISICQSLIVILRLKDGGEIILKNDLNYLKRTIPIKISNF